MSARNQALLLLGFADLRDPSNDPNQAQLLAIDCAVWGPGHLAAKCMSESGLQPSIPIMLAMIQLLDECVELTNERAAWN